MFTIGKKSIQSFGFYFVFSDISEQFISRLLYTWQGLTISCAWLSSVILQLSTCHFIFSIFCSYRKCWILHECLQKLTDKTRLSPSLMHSWESNLKNLFPFLLKVSGAFFKLQAYSFRLWKRALIWQFNHHCHLNCSVKRTVDCKKG